MSNETCATFCGCCYLLDVVSVDPLILDQLVVCQLSEAEFGRQKVIEIMSDAAAEFSCQRHF